VLYILGLSLSIPERFLEFLNELNFTDFVIAGHSQRYLMLGVTSIHMQIRGHVINNPERLKMLFWLYCSDVMQALVGRLTM
jgi:hypothetical protein